MPNSRVLRIKSNPMGPMIAAITKPIRQASKNNDNIDIWVVIFNL